MFNYFGTHSHLYRLKSRKEKSFQFLIKIVAIYHIFKAASRFKLMCKMIGLHVSPIVSQTKITDDLQNLFCLNIIIHNQSTQF